MERLDRDLARDRRLLGLIDAPKATLPQLADNLVLPQEGLSDEWVDKADTARDTK
jgi:hypothetical protein